MKQLQTSDQAYQVLRGMANSDQIMIPLSQARAAVELQQSVDEAQTVSAGEEQGNGDEEPTS